MDSEATAPAVKGNQAVGDILQLAESVCFFFKQGNLEGQKKGCKGTESRFNEKAKEIKVKLKSLP